MRLCARECALDVLRRRPVVTIRMTHGRVALCNAILPVGFRPRQNSDTVVGRKATCTQTHFVLFSIRYFITLAKRLKWTSCIKKQAIVNVWRFFEHMTLRPQGRTNTRGEQRTDANTARLPDCIGGVTMANVELLTYPQMITHCYAFCMA